MKPSIIINRQTPSSHWLEIITLLVAVAALLTLTGCASTKMSNHQTHVGVGEKLPKPDNIWVYDFAATSADVPAYSTFAGPVSSPQTEEQIAEGRELGHAMAKDLAEDITDMGIPAWRAFPITHPEINDIVIRGYLVSVDEGSTTKRMVVGFGAGGSELETVVEVYQMTPSGLRKLGSATMNSEGAKGPGAAVGAASWLIIGNPVGLIVGGGLKIYGEASGSSKIEGRANKTAHEIADELKVRFELQGWID